ncbi:MAG: hypothetical protein GY906_09650 [bacterium]|nr:hypothetical protein [bacterium]
MNSRNHSDELDLERDLPTTAEDVQALRSARLVPQVTDLKDLNRLDASRYFPSAAQRKTVFKDQPPFEL